MGHAFTVLFVEPRGDKLFCRRISMNPNHHGPCDVGRSKKTARNHFDRQMAVYPERMTQVKGKALFADVAGFRSLLKSVTSSIHTANHSF